MSLKFLVHAEISGLVDWKRNWFEKCQDGGIMNVIWGPSFSQNRPGFGAMKTILNFWWLDTTRVVDSHLFSLQHACHGHLGIASIITMAEEQDKTNWVPASKSYPMNDMCHSNTHFSLAKTLAKPLCVWQDTQPQLASKRAGMHTSHVHGRRENWMFLKSSGNCAHMLNLRYPAVRKDMPDNLEEVRQMQR